MNKALFSTWILCLLGLHTIWAQHTFLNFSVEDGLAQSSVSAITEDRQGQLWIGTQGGGLSVYDGQEFVRYNTANGIPNDYINALLTTDAGIWMGTNHGLGFYDYEQFDHILPVSGKPLKIMALTEWNNQIYLGTDHGVWRYDTIGHALDIVYSNQFAGDIIEDLLVIDDRLILATHRGISIISQDSIQWLREPHGLSSPLVRRLIPLSEQKIIALTALGCQNVFQTSKTWRIDSTFVFSAATDILPRDLNRIWVGNAQGIWEMNTSDSNAVRIQGNRTGQPADIQTFFQDSWDNIWIGTAQQGLYKHLGQRFTYFNQFGRWTDEPIYCLNMDSKNILVGVGNHGLYEYTGRRWISADSTLMNIRCSRILPDLHGVEWIGTESQGLYGRSSDTIWNHDQIRGYPIGSITAMEMDSNGTIWIGTQNRGIFTIEKFDTLDYDILHFLSGRGWENTTITDFHVDLQNNIWFSTNDGRLGVVDEDGLSGIFGAAQKIPAVPIRSIVEDGLGRLIIGTAGQGILLSDLYIDSILFRSPQAFPFKSLNVSSLLVDREGNIWMGTERGMERFQLTENTQVINHIHYTREQGFLSVENLQDASGQNADGDLWFGTTAGLIRYTENLETDVEMPPRLAIEAVSLFNKILERHTTGIDSFRTTENNLSFQFEAIHLNRAKDIRYQWRLQGYESSWTPYSRTTFVNYPNLPPGQYRFEVKACLLNAHCSPISVYEFIIKKPFWRTGWFYSSSIAILLLMIILIIRNRLKSIRKKTQRIQMENKLIELEQKALQLQMNPHFLFNALNSIQGTMSEGSIPKARTQLTQFAKLMRAILTNSKEDLLPLAQELEMLEQYIQVEQFCRGHQFDYRIIWDDEIDPEEIMIPSMVLQPFVENAIIHGLSSIDYPGVLQISFVIKGNILECTIEDNGIGYETSQKSKSAKTHASLGMEVTHDRLKMMSPNKKVDRVFIKDLNSQGGQGTQVKVNIPLQYF